MMIRKATKEKAKSYGELTLTILAMVAAGAAVELIAGLRPGERGGRLRTLFHYYAEDKIRKAVQKLRIRKLIKFDLNDEHNPIVLTKKGFVRMEQLSIIADHNVQPKKWDHLWRLVIFDVSESMRKQRDRFRAGLKNMGWYPFQYSVFVHPHDKIPEATRLAKVCRIERKIAFITTASLGSFEYDVREHFFQKLKKV